MKQLKYQTAKQKKKIHAEAMKRWQDCTSREFYSRRYSIEDKIHNSAHGGQWADFSTTKDGGVISGITNDSTTDQRPRYELNIAAPVITKLVGEQRQMDIGPQLSPEGVNASKKEVEMFEGIIRHIEKNSHARDGYDNAYNEELQGGYGGWQITTRFADEDVFEQEIAMEPIDDATSSLYFGPSKLYDKSDAPYAFLAFDMDKDVFKATYPKASVTDFADDTNFEISSINEDWFNEDTIRLAVYWRKRSTKKTIVQLSDGKIEDLKDIEDVIDELALGKPLIDPQTQQQVIDPTTGLPAIIPGSEITIVNQRETDSYVLEKFVLNGVEILEQNTTYKGKLIPLIPVFGERQVIEGAEIIHGKIRFTKDAARVFNYAFSSITEKAALSRPDILMMTPEQMAGHETELAEMNVSRRPVMPYNTIDDEGDPIVAPPPFAIAPPTVEMALINLAETAKINILAVMGTSGQTTIDGTAMDSRSGQAITAAQTGADTGSFLYLDNLLKSVEYSYKVLVDLIPHIYDTQRQIRILKPDGETEVVTINEEVVDRQGGGTTLVNDLSFGKFGVSVKSGPAFATARAEAASGLMRILEIMPNLANEASDILLGLQDNTGSEELASRVKEGKIRRGELVPSEEEAKEMGLERDQLVIQNARAGIEQEVMQSIQAQEAQARIAALNGQAQESQARAQTQVSTAQLNGAKGEAEIIKAQGQLVKDRMAASKGEADNRLTDMQTNKTANEAYNLLLDGLIKQARDLGAPITILEHDARLDQLELIELSQLIIDPTMNADQQAAQDQINNLRQVIQGRQGGLRVV